MAVPPGNSRKELKTGIFPGHHRLQETQLLVRSFDDSWNVTPAPAQSQLSITVIPVPTAEVCVTNDSVFQFNAGNTGTDTRVTPDGNGALIARPGDQQDFEGSTLPAGFSAGSWSGSNAPQFGGGKVTRNGVRIYSNIKYPTGSTIEFYAKFSDDSFENIGFAANGNFSGPWAVIKQTRLHRSVFTQGQITVGASYWELNLTGQYHRFKITLNSNNGVFCPRRTGSYYCRNHTQRCNPGQ